MLEKWLIAFNMFCVAFLGIAFCVLNNNQVDQEKRLTIVETKLDNQCSYIVEDGDKLI